MAKLCWAALLTALLAAPSSGQGRGIEYRHLQREGPLSIHVLRVDPERAEIELVRALNDGLGRETVSSMARRSGARAAVNAGFFTIGGRYDGLSTGVLKIEDGFYASPSRPRGALGWTRDGQALIGRLLMSWTLQTSSGAISLDGINRARGNSQLILYTWAYHRSTLTDPGGREWALWQGRVKALGGNDLAVPPDGYVLSAGRQAQAVELAEGDQAGVSYAFRPQGATAALKEGEEEADQQWASMDFIVGGAGVVLRNGRLVEDFSAEETIETFITNKHPRTAVGFGGQGQWVVVAVDGRQAELSVGLTLPELGALMKELGCRDALNLDGGGSTTFVYRGKVLNSPSDFGQERPVSDAIVFK
ncbi:MAG TPA: phosphodiester glycosidase family protein [Acidobacteriota bacterium]|nr:phosphodiester glycosidase family protein [Acidobacteriota bacterium]